MIKTYKKIDLRSWRKSRYIEILHWLSFALWFLFVSAEYFLQKAFQGTMLLKVQTSWYMTNLFPLSVSGQIKKIIDVQTIIEPEKHFLECCQAWIWISSLNHQFFHYLSHHLFSTHKRLALALVLVDFNIFWIFVMIILLNITLWRFRCQRLPAPALISPLMDYVPRCIALLCLVVCIARRCQIVSSFVPGGCCVAPQMLMRAGVLSWIKPGERFRSSLGSVVTNITINCNKTFGVFFCLKA